MTGPRPLPRDGELRSNRLDDVARREVRRARHDETVGHPQSMADQARQAGGLAAGDRRIRRFRQAKDRGRRRGTVPMVVIGSGTLIIPSSLRWLSIPPPRFGLPG